MYIDKDGAYNLITAVVKQAAAEYKHAFKVGDRLTCRTIDRQIHKNELVNAAGFIEGWEYFTSGLARGKMDNG